MTAVKYVTQAEMKKRTGMDALGYAKPRNALILIRKGLPKDVEMEVREHEFEHIKKGEEGPFLMPIVSTAMAFGNSIISNKATKDAAVTNADASTYAARLQSEAQAKALEEQRRQFDLTRSDTAPYRQAGARTLGYLGSLLIPGKDGTGSGFMPTEFQPGEFEADPGYQFRVDQGEQGQQNYLAANGMRLSGAALKAMDRFRQGLASDEYGKFYSRGLAKYQQTQQDKQNYLSNLFQMAGFGPTGINTSATAGANLASGTSNTLGNTANAIGNITMNNATNQANLRLGNANNWNNSMNSAMNNWIAYQQQQNAMNQWGNNNVPGDAYQPSQYYYGR